MLYLFDKEIYKEHRVFAGVDEAGRGPLAGPVYAAAVILDLDNPIEGLGDSKKLTPKKREELYKVITGQAVAWSVGFASESEIDEINILNATFLAMNRAVAGLGTLPEYVLVDGNSDPGISIATQLVIKGDASSASIAAASILAKVTRDNIIVELDKVYPQYCFAKHKGYPTKLHYEMLDEHGPCPIHRQSFLRKWQGRK